MILMNRKRNVFLVFTIAWIGVIYFFTLQPGDTSGDISESFLMKLIRAFPSLFGDAENISGQTLEEWHYILRKCAHFSEYMVLGVLSAGTFLQTRWKHKVMYGFLFCVIIAMSDETIQLFVPERAGRIMDVLIDSVGAFAGVCLMVVITLFLKRKQGRSNV